MIDKIRRHVSRYAWDTLFRPESSQQRSGATRQRRRPRVDHRTAWRVSADEEWAFERGCVQLNGEPVEDFLATERPEVGLWSDIMDGLQAYRDWAYAAEAPAWPRLAEAINQVQNRILYQMDQVYQTRVGGVALTWHEGKLLINNVNVRALMCMYHMRPTERARRFLEGMKAKLALILCQHGTNPQVARAVHAVQDLYHELSESLARQTINALCLPADRGSVGGSAV